MSKKTTTNTTSSASPPKTVLSNNSYFRWQSGPFMPTPISQLALPPPTSVPASLWTPIGAPIQQGFGYPMPFGPQMRSTFGPPPGVGTHNYCCLAGQRHQCQSYDHNCNGWPNNSSNVCWHHNPREFEGQANAASNGVAINEVKDDTESEESTDGSVNSAELKTRKSAKHHKPRTDENNKNEVKKMKEKFLSVREKVALEYIEKFQLNLKKYGDFIRQEANRFYTNDTMSKKLQPIVEQLTSASAQAKEEKEKIRQTVATARLHIKNDKDFNFEDFTLSSISLPDLPDLLTFYKSILDGIPTVFLSDLTQLKKMANDLIPNKNKIPVSTSLSLGLSFADEPSSLKAVHPLPSASNSLFAVPPNISELPKPDFNTLPLKPSTEPIATAKEPPPALEFNFPRSVSPIPLPHSIEDSAPSPPLLDIITPAQAKEKSISPIGKPVQQSPVIDLKDIIAGSSLKNGQNNTLSAIGESLRPKAEPKLETDSIRAPFNRIPLFKNLTNSVTEAKSPPSDATSPPPFDFPLAVSPPIVSAPPVNSAAKPVLNQAQNRLLIKLKEKYPTLSDDQLTESMAKTKAQIIASGIPKGFTGMKVADIITKISDYIDKNVSTNSRVFNKPRLVEMRSSSFESNTMTIGGDDNKPSTQVVTPKTWKSAIQQTASKIDVSTCSICFEPISTQSKYETECHHFFHNACISNWIRTDGSCPICRCHVLPPEEFPHLS